MSVVKNILVFLYKVYKLIAISLGTVVVILCGLFFYDYYSDYLVKEHLPNGYVLSPTNFNRNKIQVLDDGEQVVKTVGSVMWCDDVIYGTRYEKLDVEDFLLEGLTHVSATYYFLYDRKTKSHEQYDKSISYGFGIVTHHTDYFTEGKKKFNARIESLGLPQFEFKKSVTFLDLNDNSIKVSSDEKCRVSGNKVANG